MSFIGYKIKDGDNYNRPPKELEFYTDDLGVDGSNFSNYMANNFNNYDEEIEYIPQGTVGILYTSTNMYVAKFVESEGVTNPENGWKQGGWFLITKCPRITI